MEEEVEVDVEGEGYGTEEEPGVAYNRSGGEMNRVTPICSVPVLMWLCDSVSEDMELDDPQPEVDPEPEAEPTSALRIRLKVKADTSRPVRAAAKKSGKMTKRVALEAAMSGLRILSLSVCLPLAPILISNQL